MATVQEKLTSEGILASPEWMHACLEWIDQNKPNISPADRLFEVQDQWLSADITNEGVQDAPCLPPGLADQVKCQLPGRYLLQVQYAYDIGNPAYGQLQKLRNVDVENLSISGEYGYEATQGETKFQDSWIPKPKRMMMLKLTDGFQTVQAREHETNLNIPDNINPGAKIELKGPLTCRKGVILITKDNFNMLGGEVKKLVPEFNQEKVLAGKIGQMEGPIIMEFNQFMTENLAKEQSQIDTMEMESKESDGSEDTPN